MRLQKDLYRETGMFTTGLFGLSRDQMRAPVAVQNAGWYNAAGQYIGHGDLGSFDLRRIAAELEGDEVFIVMREDDWRYEPSVVRKGGPGGKGFYMELGAEYVERNCAMLVVAGAIICVKSHVQTPAAWAKGALILAIEREQVAELLRPTGERPIEIEKIFFGLA